MTGPRMGVTIGDRIRRRRELTGMTIRHAASVAGISHTHWSRIERGERGTDNRFTLAKIAEALRCPVAELIGLKLGPADRDSAVRHAAMYGAIQAMLDADLDFPATAPAQPVGRLNETMNLIFGLRNTCDYMGVARTIADAAAGLVWVSAWGWPFEDDGCLGAWTPVILYFVCAVMGCEIPPWLSRPPAPAPWDPWLPHA